MLIDDVNTNKGIGFHGAKDIQSNLNYSKGISILTHCNTGRFVSLIFFIILLLDGKTIFFSAIHTSTPDSIAPIFTWQKRSIIPQYVNFYSLATAGYGTALGVIRTLHANGTLETAFCTETRPFNQVNISSLLLIYDFWIIFLTVMNEFTLHISHNLICLDLCETPQKKKKKTES